MKRVRRWGSNRFEGFEESSNDEPLFDYRQECIAALNKGISPSFSQARKEVMSLFVTNAVSCVRTPRSESLFRS
ncbi:hypothetical protein GJAV_G00022500 [Gymnothorax javanicus]|nr:hypothetical protein GJAV_G00022500 [Gymnothorax javanicus]